MKIVIEKCFKNTSLVGHSFEMAILPNFSNFANLLSFLQHLCTTFVHFLHDFFAVLDAFWPHFRRNFGAFLRLKQKMAILIIAEAPN